MKTWGFGATEQSGFAPCAVQGGFMQHVNLLLRRTSVGRRIGVDHIGSSITKISLEVVSLHLEFERKSGFNACKRTWGVNATKQSGFTFAQGKELTPHFPTAAGFSLLVSFAAKVKKALYS